MDLVVKQACGERLGVEGKELGGKLQRFPKGRRLQLCRERSKRLLGRQVEGSVGA